MSYKIPEALRFTQSFCRECGGKLPRVDPERKLAVVPMGALDDDPGIRPQRAHLREREGRVGRDQRRAAQHAAYPPDA